MSIQIRPVWFIGKLFVAVVLLPISFFLPIISSASDLGDTKKSLGSESIVRLNGLQGVSVRTVFQPSTSDTLKTILSSVPDQPVLGVLLDSSLLSGRLKSDGEMVDSRPSGPMMQDNGNSFRYRLIRFGFNGEENKFRYGGSYRVAGEGGGVFQDQASKEIWGEWTVETIRFRTALTDRWNNVGRDPSKPRLSGTQVKTTLAMTRPAWPELTITYARESARSSLEPSGVLPQRNLIDSMEAALFYADSRWNARLFSVYSINRDGLRAVGEGVGVVHAISGSYQATDRVTIAPTMSVKSDQQRWSGIRQETPSASLMVTYVQSPTFNMTAFGSYSQTRRSDGLVETNISKMASVFTWIYSHTPTLRTTVSLDTSYTALLDTVQPARSSEDLSGLLRLQFVGL